MMATHAKLGDLNQSLPTGRSKGRRKAKARCVRSASLVAECSTAPTNTNFWDPAGFTADNSVENFACRRQTELKHGRISMLATMGYITPELAGPLVHSTLGALAFRL